mgnify:CR=1 FL=1
MFLGSYIPSFDLNTRRIALQKKYVTILRQVKLFCLSASKNASLALMSGHGKKKLKNSLICLLPKDIDEIYGALFFQAQPLSNSMIKVGLLFLLITWNTRILKSQ